MKQVGMASTFKADVDALPMAIRAKFSSWWMDFLADPDDPRFEAHRLKRALMPGLWTAKVDNAYRVIFRRTTDGMPFLLLVGRHDDVYRRAEKLRFVDRGSMIALAEPADLEQAPAGGRPALQVAAGTAGSLPAAEGRSLVAGRTFMAWTDDELRRGGVPEHLLVAVRACDSDDDLLDLAERAGERWGEFLLGLNEALTLLHGAASPVAADASAQPSLLAGDDATRKVEAALRSDAAAGTIALLEPDELTRVLAQPIEDWMIFLHPDQAKVVRRRTMGPARVRGAAGTGKTVVGLHRAAFLAHELARHADPGRILFTTFIRSLPPVLAGLLERLAPEAAERVEFVNVHRWASQLLRARDLPAQVNPQAQRAAFDLALDTAAGRRLLDAGFSRAYLDEEVQFLIKGRALATVGDYLDLPRTARGTPLRAEQRRDVWQVAQAYGRRSAEWGFRDFSDLIIDAWRSLAARPLDPPYAAIVVDEAQDLTEAALRMLMAALRPGGELLLVGDGQQSIYPGGFSLRSLGLDVRGRSTVLATAYRNTAEIMAAAMAVMAGHDYDDLEDETSAGARDVIPVRHGPAPVVQGFRTRAGELRWLADDIRGRTAASDVGLGDVAVLCPTNADAEEILGTCRQRSLAVQSLASYTGHTTHAVKVGTYNRAKGLEFKVVYLPGVCQGAVSGVGGDDADEAGGLERRRFFVGMTRARDRLIISYSGTASAFLASLTSRAT